MGGMAEARKKGMGLKMKRGGSVKKRAKSSSKNLEVWEPLKEVEVLKAYFKWQLLLLGL